MKLKQEFEHHQQIWNFGYRFDPEEEVFYTSDLANFNFPQDYDHWKVQKIDRYEYLNERLSELGVKEIITDKNTLKNNEFYFIDSVDHYIQPNHYNYWLAYSENLKKISSNSGLKNWDVNVNLFDENGNKYDAPIFVANKFGDIEIIQYSLKRQTFYYDKSTTSTGTRTAVNVQKRINPLYTEFTEGKYDFSEGKNTPFWHPRLIEIFEKKEKISTLVITEGQIKAYKATEDGILTVGLGSISHFRDGRTNALHTEIIEFIHACEVKNVVVLWDADCVFISSSDLENETEITKRPASFYHYARSIKNDIYKIFSPKKLQVYFSTIKKEAKHEPKGIDDLLCVKEIPSKDVVIDFDRIGQIPGYYIDWINITTNDGEKTLRSYFSMNNVYNFYSTHKELIGTRNFVFYGTTYKIEDNTPVVEIDKDLKAYMRIGADYFRLMQEQEYDSSGDLVRHYDSLVPWKTAEITRDFGKGALDQCIKLDGFCNVPNNVDYKPIINKKWNLYSDAQHDIKEGDFPVITKFLKHIFQEQYQMGLDYLQLLYTKPRQKLPILTLASKLEGTGKSSFLKLLYIIFQNNMTYVTPDDIMSNWSSHWASKLIVASEETFFEKKEALEKLKNLSTADKIMRHERFVNSTLIDNFLKFVFCTNSEDDFIRLSKQSSRFWIIKVNKIAEEDKILNIEDKFQTEVSHFLHFLQNRDISYPQKDRMWFHPTDFRTAAFDNVVKNSEPGLIKDLRLQFEEYFSTYGTNTLDLCVKDLKQYFGAKGNDYYLNNMIKEYFKAEKTATSNWYQFYFETYNKPDEPTVIKGKGKYFTFKREDFVNAVVDYEQLKVKYEN